MDCKFVTLLIIFYGIIGCNNDKKIHVLDVQITFKENWNHEKLKSIDSTIDIFTNELGDTIYFKKIKETPKIYDIPIIMSYRDKKLIDSLNIPNNEIFFSEQPSLDRDLCIYSNEYYIYHNLNNTKCMLKIPKLNKQGVFGISIKNINDKNESIIVYTNKMSFNRVDEILSIFNSIKW